MTLQKIRRKTTVLFIYVIAFVILLSGVIVISLSARDRQIFSSGYTSFKDTRREYLIANPISVTEDSRIIIGIHGFSDTARRFAYYTGLHNSARPSDIVIYPQAITPQKNQKTGWNAGFCCGSGWVQKADDVGFIIDLIESVKQQYSAHNAKVYVAGFSNGAFMAQRLATDRPDVFSGIAAVSGSIGTIDNRLEPTQPIPIFLMHGEKDITVSFNGGAKASDPDFSWLPFATTLEAWKSLNKATGTATKAHTFKDLGHRWKDWRIVNFWHTRPQASEEIMNFFNSL